MKASGGAIERAPKGLRSFFYDVMGGLSQWRWFSLLWGALFLLDWPILRANTQTTLCRQPPTDLPTEQKTAQQTDPASTTVNQNTCVDCGLPRCPSQQSLPSQVQTTV